MKPYAYPLSKEDRGKTVFIDPGQDPLAYAGLAVAERLERILEFLDRGIGGPRIVKVPRGH